MDDSTPQTNPLQIIAFVAVLALATDCYHLLVNHSLNTLGVVRVIAAVVFLALYALRSRFAWYIPAVSLPLIIVLWLLLPYLGVDADRSRPHYQEAMLVTTIIEIILLVVALRYLWRIRKPYLRYIGELRDSATPKKEI